MNAPLTTQQKRDARIDEMDGVLPTFDERVEEVLRAPDLLWNAIVEMADIQGDDCGLMSALSMFVRSEKTDHASLIITATKELVQKFVINEGTYREAYQEEDE